MMARYNLWQNESLAKAASEISGSERQKDRGAFFGSIEKTFSPILWSDRLWLKRFESTDGPGGNIASSVSLIANWGQFREERAALDRQILEWAHGVSAEWLEGDLTWFAGSIGREKTNIKTLLVVQMFNHQTHHRGQIHAMLTASGAKPEATDLQHMPERYFQI